MLELGKVSFSIQCSVYMIALPPTVAGCSDYGGKRELSGKPILGTTFVNQVRGSFLSGPLEYNCVSLLTLSNQPAHQGTTLTINLETLTIRRFVY